MSMTSLSMQMYARSATGFYVYDALHLATLATLRQSLQARLLHAPSRPLDLPLRKSLFLMLSHRDDSKAKSIRPLEATIYTSRSRVQILPTDHLQRSHHSRSRVFEETTQSRNRKEILQKRYKINFHSYHAVERHRTFKNPRTVNASAIHPDK